MKHSKYPFTVEEAHTKYEFTSEGTKGSIVKTVVYAQIRSGIFNLSFGDWNAEIENKAVNLLSCPTQ